MSDENENGNDPAESKIEDIKDPETAPKEPENAPSPPTTAPPATANDELAETVNKLTETVAGLVTTVSQLVQGKDETPVKVPWTHRGSKRR